MSYISFNQKKTGINIYLKTEVLKLNLAGFEGGKLPSHKPYPYQLAIGFHTSILGT